MDLSLTEPRSATQFDTIRPRRRVTDQTITFLSTLLRMLDALLIGAAGLYVFAAAMPEKQFLSLPDLKTTLVAVTIIAPLLLAHGGFYRHLDVRRAPSILARLAAAAILLVIASGAAAAVETLNLCNTAPFLLQWILLSVGAMLLARTAAEGVLGVLNSNGAIRERVAIVGAGPAADALVQRGRATAALKFDLVGIFDDRSAERFGRNVTAPNGTLDDLLAFARDQTIDHVVITFPASADRRLSEVTRKLKGLAVDVSLCPEKIAFTLPSCDVSFLGDLPLLQLARRPIDRWSHVLKSIEDRVLGTALIVLFSPLLLLVAILVKLSSPGPVLFQQTRHGFNNTEFSVFKFRTMRAEVSDYSGGQQTKRGDSRITPVGAFLRRSSVDELPQLFNVLRGEMSLVGPRPHPVGMRTRDRLSHEIVEDYAHRHRVKPGITGWAQINGYRGATDEPYQLKRRVEYDVQYIENWSIGFDLKILFLTIFRLLTDRNAF